MQCILQIRYMLMNLCFMSNQLGRNQLKFVSILKTNYFKHCLISLGKLFILLLSLTDIEFYINTLILIPNFWILNYFKEIKVL